ncbi:hypothetical protein PSACC_00070 [Paramicrosporidium saccamoebae]|uniref:Uncharacterized protein n=1 Tax=Paramicrosporidium saccamoebae TaxID=1246581 RepID=A0A2H9TQU6_9FUNG|nr:hypothetical protein PSACC_00070 [Paramicrosporidium saccamoebae]
MENLLDCLVDGTISSGQLDSLRELCREPINAEAVLARNGTFDALLRLREVNAMKTMANLLYHSPDARARYTGENANELVEFAKENGGEERFVALRLLFLVSIEKDTAIALKDSVSTLMQLAGDDREVVEVLRILYNTSKYSSAPNYSAFAWKYLESGDPVIVGNVYNLFLNMSVSTLRHETGHTAELLQSSLNILLRHYETPDGHCDAIAFLPAACLTIHRLAEAFPDLRKTLRRSILPSTLYTWESLNILVTVLVPTIGFQVRLAISFSSSVPEKVLASPTLTVVLRLLYHLGYGRIAGFLYAQDLLPSADILTQTADLGSSSDEEAVRKDGMSGIDPVTAQTIKNSHESNEMTETEKEEESKRLLELFDRLEKTGIKVFPAGPP